MNPMLSCEEDLSVVSAKAGPASLSPSSSINLDDIIPEDTALVETQPQTQPQHDSPAVLSEQNLIGCLIPATASCTYYELSKSRLSRSWSIGRNAVNDLIVEGEKLSNFHCVLHWNGEIGRRCEVKLTDISSKGTWVDNVQLTKGHSALIRSGSAISLGGMPSFIYRDIEGRSMQNGPGFWEKYDIGHELGSGAFARVHECVSQASGIEYAVKIIERRKFHPQEKEMAQEREIWILKNLMQVTHRNIASFQEHFEEGDTIYLILELVRGGNLLKYLSHRGALPELQARRMAAQICDAVAYIHSQGVTHRDLKLENIMVTSSDPPDCKLVDFGLAKSGPFLQTLCGTPAYLAPELKADGHLGQVYDNRVDSWSLGIIFHCMLTNHTPFRKPLTTMTATAGAYSGPEEIDWSLLQTMDISHDGQDFLRQLLALDPLNRKEVAFMLQHPWISTFLTSAASGAVGISDTIYVRPSKRRCPEITAAKRKRRKTEKGSRNGVHTERVLRRSAQIAALASRNTKRNGKESRRGHFDLEPCR